jgi:hypothetical protein
MKLHDNNIPFDSMNFTTSESPVCVFRWVSIKGLTPRGLARGEVIAQGPGSEMQSKGIRQLVSI